MKKASTPSFKIGANISGTTGAHASSQVMTGARPGAGIEKLLWRVALASKAAALGGVAIAGAYGSGAQKPMEQSHHVDTNHPDHPGWDKHFGRK